MAHQPSDEAHRSTDRSPTRRRYLAGIATAGSILTAGCLGGDGGGGGDGDSGDGGGGDDGGSTTASSTGSSSSSSNGATDGSGSSGSGSSGSGTGGQSGSECLGEFTYVNQGYSAMGDSGYVGQCEIPDAAEIRSGGGEGTMAQGVTAVVTHPSGDYTSISVQGDLRQSSDDPPTVGSRIRTYQETADQTEWVEVTDRHDLAVDGARAIAGSEDAIPSATVVVAPVSNGVLQSTVSADNSGCQAASERFYTRVIESIQPV